MAAIKAADIQTHHAPHMDEDPWVAIPMTLAKEAAKGYVTDSDSLDTVADICASACVILDEAGLIFYGDTEAEAQDKALAYVQTRKEPTP